MCKVFIATGIERTNLVRKVMELARPQMSRGNLDGIGYTAVTKDNKMFMQRWHDNHKFLDTESVLTDDDIKQLEPFKNKLPRLSVNHETIGNVDLDNVTSFTMHTRFATCGKEFKNTHPFVVDDYSLIHNGVIRNADQIGLNKISSCDSENALQLFIQNKLNEEISASKIQPFLDAMRGYWAFGIFSKNLEGQYQLDVVKDGAQLSFAYIPELGANCVVFVTDEKVMLDVCKQMGFEAPTFSKFIDHVFHRFDALTGDIIAQIDVEESTLNKTPTYTKSYYSYGYRSYNDYEDSNEFERFFGHGSATKHYEEVMKNVTEPKPSKEDQDWVDYFYDTENPLAERLENYDAYMVSTYHETYTKSMPPKLVRFIERQEEKDLICFEDVIKLIEVFNATGDAKKVVQAYQGIIRRVG